MSQSMRCRERAAEEQRRPSSGAMRAAMAIIGSPRFVGHFLPADEIARSIDYHTCAKEMLDALEFVEEFFAKLERDTAPDDPLRKLREQFHAPIHNKLRPLIAKVKAAV